MITITKPNTHRIEIALSGQIDGDEMNAALGEFVEKCQGITEGQILYRATEFPFPTPYAFAIEIGYLPKRFGLLRQVQRIALLSDIQPVRAAAEVQGAFLPGIEVKSFPLGSSAAAEAWLTGQDVDDDHNDASMPV